jgi:glycosyltransferase involved in cell wall biosynthesis
MKNGKIVFLYSSKENTIPSSVSVRQTLESRTPGSYDYLDSNHANSQFFYRFFKIKVSYQPLVTVGLLFLLLTRIAKKSCPKLLVATTFSTVGLCYFFKIFLKIPFVYFEYEVIEDNVSRSNWLIKKFYKRILNSATLVIFPSRIRQNFRSIVTAHHSPSVTVANSARASVARMSGTNIRKDLGIANTEIMILYMGGIGESVGLPEFFASLRKHLQFKIVLCGWSSEIYLKKLKTRVSELNLNDRVIFVGSVKNKQDYYDAADIGYCVYKPESLGIVFSGTASNKLNEYLSCGIPLITTADEAFSWIIYKYNCGLCLERVESADFSKLLKKFRDPAVLKSFKVGAQLAFSEEFNCEMQIQPILKYFQPYENQAK